MSVCVWCLFVFLGVFCALQGMLTECLGDSGPDLTCGSVRVPLTVPLCIISVGVCSVCACFMVLLQETSNDRALVIERRGIVWNTYPHRYMMYINFKSTSMQDGFLQSILSY